MKNRIVSFKCTFNGDSEIFILQGSVQNNPNLEQGIWLKDTNIIKEEDKTGTTIGECFVHWNLICSRVQILTPTT